MKITQDVLEVLDHAETDGSSLRLVGQLDRKLYERTNKVLELLGGKWNRSAKAHLFPSDAADLVSAVIVAGEITDPKKTFDAFFTPDAVAKMVIQAAQIEPGMKVLEPSAGRGALAVAARYAGAKVSCIEVQPENIAYLEGLGFDPLCVDFMTQEPGTPVYDRVVMNPPFSRQQDIRHVLHALRFLKPGGILVSVMSAGVKFRDNVLTRDFRALVDASGGTCESLPNQSFKESGTLINTVLITIPKS